MSRALMIVLKIDNNRVSGSMDGIPVSKEKITREIGRTLSRPRRDMKVLLTIMIVMASGLLVAKEQVGGPFVWSGALFSLLSACVVLGILMLRGPKLRIKIEGEKEIVKTTSKLVKTLKKQFKPFCFDTVKVHKGIDKKRNAGADRSVERVDIPCRTKSQARGNYLAPMYRKDKAQLIFLPGFVVAVDRHRKATAIDYTRSMLNTTSLAMALKKIPKDANLIRTSWAKLNANGTRDKRFKGNYKVGEVTVYQFRFYGKFSALCTFNAAVAKSVMTLGLFQFVDPEPTIETDSEKPSDPYDKFDEASSKAA